MTEYSFKCFHGFIEDAICILCWVQTSDIFVSEWQENYKQFTKWTETERSVTPSGLDRKECLYIWTFSVMYKSYLKPGFTQNVPKIWLFSFGVFLVTPGSAGSLLIMLRWPYGRSGIKSGLAVCKASSLPSLWSQYLDLTFNQNLHSLTVLPIPEKKRL